MTDTVRELGGRLRSAVEKGDYSVALSTLAALGEVIRTQPVPLDSVAGARELVDWALIVVRAQRAHLARDLADLQQTLPYLRPSAQPPMLSLRA